MDAAKQRRFEAMKRQSSIQTSPVVPGSMQSKISRSWNNQSLNSQNGLVSPMQQSHGISSCTVKIGPDFGNLDVGLVNSCSNNNVSSDTNTSVSSSVSFSHTSKGQLKYNRHEALVCRENLS